ncbi:phosphotransferase family protein [Pseudochelatococcus sp. B33]
MPTTSTQATFQGALLAAPPIALPTNAYLRPLETSTPLDHVQLAAELEKQGLALDTAFLPRQFAGGLANINYLLRLEEGSWVVLRRPPGGPLPPGANDMVREHRILSTLWRELPLAPRSLHLCTDTDVIGVPFQILEFRPGIAIRGDSVAPLSGTPETGAALSAMLVGALARIHAVDLTAVGLDALGRPEGFFARQVAGWIGRAEDACEGELPPAAREVVGWLAACPSPEQDVPVLLHCDFKLDNVLLDPETLGPGTVVDWDMGTRGPALFDLATLLSYWTEPDDPACMHRLAQMPTAGPGFLTREAAAEAYARATGRTVGGIAPYRVLTILKLAVVFLQLHRRFRSGETTDPRYAAFGDLGRDLFAFALDVARGRLF